MKTALAAAAGLIVCVAAIAVAREPASEAGQGTDLQRKLLATPNPAPTRFPSFDPRYPPPPGAKDVFQLSQDYPTSFKNESFPWMAIDFKAYPTEYLGAVLSYCLEGNLDVDFKVQDNKVRKWYHAPWLHDDGDKFGAGREYRHGMTRERKARPFELHRSQSAPGQNWAVGFYNDRGGVTLGKVWRSGGGYPNPYLSTFAENTVACKLLFTDAPVAQIPYLSGSKTWVANIYPDTAYNKPRVDRDMRLLQLDVAVKDPRVADTTGWIYGTFIYDGGSPGKSVWDRMVPVGLSWGDDQQDRTDIGRDGVFVNTRLSQARITSSLVEQTGWDYGNRAYVRHHGLGGRVNGPIDSPVSSCISCHGRAGTHADTAIGPKSGLPMAMAYFAASKPSDYPPAQFNEFFKPIPGGAHIEVQNNERFVTTDYSLQLTGGIRNFYQNLRSQPVMKTLKAKGVASADVETLSTAQPLPKVARDAD